MKKLRLLVIIGIILGCMFAIIACSGPALPTPTGLKVDENIKTLTWKPVPSATGYVIEIKGSNSKEEKQSRSNSLNISSLEPDNYEFRVKTIGDKVNFSNSKWSDSLFVTKVYESGLQYKYINGNTEYALSGLGTFRGNTVVIDREYKGKPVTAINASAFNNNYSIKKIEIPDSVTVIGERAFRNCSELVEVVLPDTITEIGKNAFQNCRKLEKINIPSSLTEIQDYTFHNCRSLTSLNFGKELKKIGDSAFLKCENLENITDLEGVETIGERAFSDCDAIRSFTVKSGLKTIGKEAFRNCNVLETVVLNNGVTEIGNSAFRECPFLRNINIPDSMINIGGSVFYDCVLLSDIEIGSGVKYIGEYAFYNTGIWNDTEQGPIYADKWIVGCVTLTEETKNVTIKNDTVGISDLAFYQATILNVDTGERMYSPLESINIPASVKYINDYAFTSCRNLTDVVIGDGVLEIGDYAFADCIYLMNFTMGKNVEVIGDYAFYGCERIGRSSTGDDVVQMKLPTTLKRIGTYAFNNTYIWEKATQIVYVGTPENVWVVGSNVNTLMNVVFNTDELNIVGISDSAFFGFEMLMSIELPNTLEYIGEAAFYGCVSLMFIEIPEGVTKINDYTFYDCVSLLAVGGISNDGEAAPLDSIESIGASAFYECFSLLGIAPLTNVKSIGQYAFYACVELASIDLGKALEHIDERAFYESGLLSVTIPGTVKEINGYAFAKCTDLEEITFDEGVIAIGQYAFNGCESLKKINFSSSVTTIGDYAFRNCSALNELTLKEGLQTIGKGAFSGCAIEHLALPESLQRVEDQAFMNNAALTSVLLSNHITHMGMHVFFGCKGITDEETGEYVEDYVGLTIYTEMESMPSEWSPRWNTSYRPVFYNCTFKDGYVESFKVTEESIANIKSTIVVAKPYREGYIFDGWAVEAGGPVVFTEDEINEVEDGTVLYAVWRQA